MAAPKAGLCGTRGRWAAWLVSACIAAAAAGTPPATAADASAYASLTAGFREGDFGTSTRSELYSLTAEGGYVGEGYDLSASIPYQHLRVSSGDVSSSASGVGDALLRGGKRLWRNDSRDLSLTGALSVKLATGDESRGLGTGGTDIGIALSGSHTLGAYTLTALAGWTQVGEPSGVDYNDVASYGIGISRRFTLSSVFASLQGQSSALPGGTAPLEFDAGFFRVLSRHYVILAHGFIGLSNGSPDHGAELGLVRWF